jgi:hypothetical protein
VKGLAQGAFWFGFCFTLATGVTCGALQVRACVHAKRSRTWPTVPGIITKARVDRVISTHDGAEYRSYRPGLEYSYVVDGKRYHHSRICYGTGIYQTAFPSYARRVIGKYQEGMVVTVSHDPSAPANAVLEPGRVGSEHAFSAALFISISGLVWRFVISRF